MKEIPILFSGSMVSAILAGRKMQTRRIVKPQPNYITENLAFGGWWGTINKTGAGKEFKCRYGKPGDLIWVREAFAVTTNVNNIENWPGRPHKSYDDGYTALIYRADGPWDWCDEEGFSTEKSYWKPSIHMPKDAARIWLRNTGVRVERLNDISEKDAIAEGIECHKPVPGDGLPEYKNYQYGQDQYWGGFQNIGKLRTFLNPDFSFRTLIQSIHGPEVWNENPFVWVISFEVLSTTGRDAI